MRYVAAWLSTIVLSGCGCAESHVRDDAEVSDAGSEMDARAIDAPVVRRDAGAPAPDGPLPDGTDCSEVAGYRRCGLDDCPYLCPGSPPVRCDGRTTLCLPRLGDNQCGYDIGELSSTDLYCDPNLACLISGDHPPEDDTSGRCVALDLCLVDYRDVDLPPFHCVWSDMTLVTRAPPAATCPAPADARAPFCGGACGDDDPCTPRLGTCIGLGDTRGFGACASLLPCYESMGVTLFGWLDTCSREHGAPCACMIMQPQPPEAPFPRGNITLASTCLAYQAVYPDGVECRDADWQALP